MLVDIDAVIEHLPRRGIFSGAGSEERWFTWGIASDGKLRAILHTCMTTGPASATTGIDSAREPTRSGRRHYQNALR